MSLLDTASLIVTPNGYKEGKLYSVIPSDGSGDLSVTRATTATRVNSAGLVELVPYNLVQYSETFASPWGALSGASVSANSATAPNGQNTAATFSVTSTAFSGFIQTLGTNAQCISIYAKKGTLDYLWIVNESISAIGASYNLATGAVTYTASGHTATIESVGNGWYRCTISHPTNGWEYMQFGLSNASNSGSSPSGGNAYIWGAQAVQGSTAKDYQKTETRLNIPRLDYSNGTCPSLLVEPQRTNLLTYSSSFDNAAWTKYQASITANNTTDPSGVLSADKFLDSTSNDIHATYAAFLISSATTISAYVKSAEYTRVAISNLSDGGDVIFNLADGTIVSTPGNFVNSQIESLENGWYRISATTNGTSGYKAIGYSLVNNSNQTSFAGTGTSGLFIWGAQIEVGSYSTSYIPTTSASVTRNADVISKTGISSLIGQTEGTLFVDEIYDSNAKNNGGLDDTLISLTDGTSNNLISIFHYGGGVGTILLFIRLSNTTQVAISTSASTSGAYKIALAYKNNDVVGYVNGVQIGTDTSAIIPATSAVVFYDPVTTNSATKTINIKAAALWKTRLTNAQLATLTTL